MKHTGINRIVTGFNRIISRVIRYPSRSILRALLRTHRRKFLAIGLSLLILLSSLATYLTFFAAKPASAGWYDDAWGYRKQITFGNTGSADSNKKVLFQLDTATAITGGKMQSSCQDVRFTDGSGAILRYYINVSGGAGVGCNDASSDFYVLMPTIVVGSNLLFFYYGSPTAPAGTESVNFSQATFSPTSGPTAGSEEKGPSPSAYWKMDEGNGRAAYDSSQNQNTLRMNPLTGLEQQINILNQEFSSNSTSNFPTDNSLGLVRWDADKYSGETVYFEAIIRGDGTGGSPTFYASLYNSSGNQVSGSEVSLFASTTYTRVRSNAITLTDDTDYTVRIRVSTGARITFIKVARLIVIQSASSGISDSQIQIEVGNVERQSSNTATQLTDKKIYQYDSSKFSPVPIAYFESSLRASDPTIEQQINIIDQEYSSNSTSYIPTDNSLGLVRWDADKYSGETVYFEAIIRGDGTAGSPLFYAGLFDSGGNQVSGGEVTTGLATNIRVRSNAITLTDDTDYTVRIRVSTGARITFVRSARLIVVQTDTTNITDTQTQVEVGNNETSTATSNTQLTDKKIYRYTSAEFSPTPTVYFEATLSNDTAGQTAYASLYTDGASCSSQVTGSEVSVTGTTWTRVRSASITLSNGTDYMVCVKTSANTARIANAKIVLDQTAGGGITDVELIHQTINTLKTDADSTYTEQDFDNRLSPDVGITGGNLAGGTFTYLYEATIKTSAGTGYAELWNDTDNATITSSEVTTASTSYARARSADISANMPTGEGIDNFKDLDSRIKNSATNTTSVASTQLIIQVSNLATSDVTAYADLYNLTDATVVSGSELSTTGTSWTRVRSSSVSLTTAKDYVVRIRTGVNNAAIHLGNAKIILDQTAGSVTATEIVQEHINTLRTDADTTYTEADFDDQFDPSNFSGGIFTYNFEATLKTSAGTGYAELWNDSDNLTITGSEVTTASTSYVRVRSGDITANMPGSAKIMDTRLKNSATNTTSASTSWIIIYGSAITAGGGVARWQTEDECISGKCLVFDGVDDAAFTPITSSIDLDRELAGGFTFQGWVRVNSDGEANVGEIFDKGTTTYMRITNEGADGLANLEASLDLATTDGTVTVTDGITLNKWHHVAMTYTDNGDDEITVYIDTVNRGSSTLGDGAPAADSNDFLLGGSSGANFHGFIDEFKIYKEERSSDQIKTDFIKGTSSVHGAQAALGIRDYSFLSEGLVGYWKIEDAGADAEGETITDSSGNNHTGTLYGDNGTGDNGTGLNCTAGGKYGTGCDLDGTDDYVSVGTVSLGTTTGTMQAWVKFNTFTGNKYAIGRNYDAEALGIVNDGGYRAITRFGGVFCADYDTTLSTGTWYDIAGTYDGSNVRLYVNGQLVEICAETDTLTHAEPWAIGANQGGTGASDHWFNGIVDEARLYNRTLSPAEVSALYNFAPGPVGYWNFDEGNGTTASDRSGNDNTGSLTNMDSVSDWVPGKFGNALDFDGTNDYIDVGSPSTLSFGSGNFTYEAWIRTSTAGANKRIIAQDNNSTNYRALWHNTGANTAEFGCRDSAGNQILATGTTALSDGIWHHLTGVRNGTNGYIYVDGKLEGTGTNASTGSCDVSVSTKIGARVEATSLYFPGAIDDVRIYNYARTPSQIIEDMNAGHPAPGSPVGSPIGHWKLDEGYGDTAYDSGTGGNNGNLAGATSCPQSGDSACPTWSTSGKFDKALNFDTSGTTDDYVDMGDQTEFDLERTSPITLEAWIKTTTDAGKSILSKQDNSASDRGYQIQTGTGGLVFMQIINTYSTNGIEVRTTSDTNYDDGNWHHIMTTYDGSSSASGVKLYFDGNQQATTTSFNNLNATILNSVGLRIGARSGASPQYFNGQIDEAKIYNIVLTADQVRLAYNKGSAASFGDIDDHGNEGFGGNPPVGWWKMDENTGTGASIFDYSGNGNTGTMNGGMTESDWVPVTGAPSQANGLAGSALDFDGSNDYVSASSALNPGTSDFTFEQWMYPGNVAATTTAFGQENGTGTGRSWIEISAGALQSFLGGSTRASGYTASNNTWIHVALVHNNTANTLNWYVNGIAFNQNTGVNIESATGNFRIAASKSGEYFTGRIDDVRLYNYALTQAQVSYDFNRGGPVGYWKFDECSGTVANDSSGKGNNGTITPGDISGNNDSVGTCNSGASDPTNEMWNAGTVGKRNASLDFDGSNDYVTTSAFSPITNAGLTYKNVSWGGWFYPDNLTSTHSLIEKASEIQLFTNTSGLPTCGIYYSGSFSNAVTVGFPSLQLNAWNHVLCTYDGTFIKTYLNGKMLDSATSNTNSITAASSILYVGESSGGTQRFSGQIDEVKIYNYALTADQVKKDYNTGAQFFGPATGSP